MRAAPLALLLLLTGSLIRADDAQSVQAIAAFSDPARLWGDGIEAVIEAAYRECFKTFIIDGKVMNVRMPFAENHERDSLVEGGWEFLGKGKAEPAALWEPIRETFETDDFKEYAAALGDGKEKVVVFDIPAQKWTVSADIFDIARMKAGSYHGLPHKPYVLSGGQGITEGDVYNYLYCIAWTGMDCSAFVWHALSRAAAFKGADLGRRLSRALGVPRGGNPSFYAGTSFYNSSNRALIATPGIVKGLRPADIILFRASDGSMAHSAVVQSIDFSRGIVRYLQETDEAPQNERGTHESFIHFNPARPDVALSDPSLVWSQTRYSPFPGEKASAFSDDGQRYRAYGGGRVVRLALLASLYIFL
ncbi:MAG: peptidoglycan endopeptidase [Spirochaetaceae bacterium]|nr:peptidoglycan endopeptidase [Spirochaetaceae bacterium]